MCGVPKAVGDGHRDLVGQWVAQRAGPPTALHDVLGRAGREA